MKTSHLIKLTVKLDYRFKNIEYEELGHYLTFHIDRNNLFSITFKNKFLASPFIIDFSENEIRQIKDGARVSFEVENFKEDLNVEHVELDLSIYIDDVNIEKAIKGRQELENFKKSITSAVGIYRLTINGSSYIGQSINLSRRLTNHIDQLISGTHSNTKLQFAWDKYPLDIIFEILEYENLNQQGIQLQDWLAFKERSYIANDRIMSQNVNILDGEVVIKKNALNEYKKIRTDAVSHIKNTRRQNKENNKNAIEHEQQKRNNASLTIVELDKKINSIRKTKGWIKRILSAIGILSVEDEEAILIVQRKEANDTYNLCASNIIKLREIERLLRKRRLSDQEIATMKSMGYTYRREYHENL